MNWSRGNAPANESSKPSKKMTIPSITRGANGGAEFWVTAPMVMVVDDPYAMFEPSGMVVDPYGHRELGKLLRAEKI
jgi:hypothetical protein